MRRTPVMVSLRLFIAKTAGLSNLRQDFVLISDRTEGISMNYRGNGQLRQGVMLEEQWKPPRKEMG